MMAFFMLYGNLNPESVEKINDIVRQLLAVFDATLKQMKYREEIRLFSHYFFAALNGILITFRKYPGRSEEEVIRHMKRLGKLLADSLIASAD